MGGACLLLSLSHAFLRPLVPLFTSSRHSPTPPHLPLTPRVPQVRGSEYIVGNMAHIHVYEQGGTATLGGVHPRVLPNLPDGTIDLSEARWERRGNERMKPRKPRTAPAAGSRGPPASPRARWEKIWR